MLGRSSGNSLSFTKTSNTVKFEGIIVANAWFVNSIDPCLPNAMFAGESYGKIGLPTGFVRRATSVALGARIDTPELNGAASAT